MKCRFWKSTAKIYALLRKSSRDFTSAVQLHEALAEGSRGRNGADERLLGRDEFDSEGEYYFRLVTSIDATPSEVAHLFQKRGDHVLLFSTLAMKVVEIGDNGLFKLKRIAVTVGSGTLRKNCPVEMANPNKRLKQYSSQEQTDAIYNYFYRSDHEQMSRKIYN